METLGSYVEKVLSKLARVHGVDNQIEDISRVFCAMSSRWFYQPYGQNQRELSSLCGDGTPIEFSISVSGKQDGLRYVVDNADACLDIYGRIHSAKYTLPSLLKSIRMYGLREEINQLFSLIFPKGTWFPDGSLFGVWYGITHFQDRTLLKLYFNIMWKSIEACRNCFGWIGQKYGLEFQNIDPIKPWPEYTAHPEAICVEFERSHIKSYKVYYRILGISEPEIENLLESVHMKEFLRELLDLDNCVLGKMLYLRPSGLMVKFPIKRIDSLSIKFVFSCSQHYLSDQEMADRISKFVHNYGYDESQYRQTLKILSEERISSTSMNCHRNVGISFSKKQDPGISVYMKPRLW